MVIGDTRALVRPRRRAQDHLLRRRDPSPVTGSLNEAGFDPGPLDPFLDFPAVQARDDIRRDLSEGTRHRQMAASDGNELDPTAPGDFLNHADIPAEVKCGHLDHCTHACLVRFVHGCHRLLQQSLAVEEFRVRVTQASSVGAHMLVTQGKAQISGLHWPQHGIHGCHDTPSSEGFNLSH